jgi:hypothetical protein
LGLLLFLFLYQWFIQSHKQQIYTNIVCRWY